jgi:predicted HTH transcriptional regulator
VDTSEIEAWTLQVVERLRSGEQLEDRRVELKQEWPKPASGSHTKTARQLAALANANYPEHVLWLVGLDEKRREVVGANAVETAAGGP